MLEVLRLGRSNLDVLRVGCKVLRLVKICISTMPVWPGTLLEHSCLLKTHPPQF